MRYDDPQLRDKLAAEYVLGTLQGAARARFQSLMRYDPGLRSVVSDWEGRLAPLAHAGADIAPPERVWQALSKHLAGEPRRTHWWESLALWRGLAATGAALALVLAIVIGISPESEPPMSMIAVMNDTQGRPAMTVSWPSMQAVRDRPLLRIRVVQEHPVMAPGTAWELWMLPGGEGKPVSLGLITTDVDQVMELKPELAARIERAWGIAMTVEPKGGSPTGQPTGPMVMKGPCVKL
jgi:anti-sigma-K factor RskA